MKKIIKLAAAFAVSGAMLATVGCQQIYEDIDDINAEIEQIEKTDISSLKSKIETCVAEIARVEAAYKADDAALKAELAAAYKAEDAQLMLAAQTLADNLKKVYDGKIDALTTQLNNAVKDLAKAADLSKLSNSVDTAKTNLRAADAKLAADIIAALQTCENARALLKSEVTTALNDSTAKYALIIAGIQSDVAAKYSELLGKISEQTAELNRVKDELAVADSTNAADLKAAKTALEKAVADAKAELQTAIDNAVAGVDSLARVTLQIVSDLADLETLVKDYKTAIYAKIKADSTATDGKIDVITTDYLAKYAELADVDTDVYKKIDSLKSVYDTKIGNLDAKDGELNNAINDLKTEYKGEVAQIELDLKKLNSVDSATAVRIDTLVASVYERISKVNDALLDSIAKTLVDAKAYTDAKIEALDLDNKLTSVRNDFADSIKAIRAAYVKQVDSVDSKYKEIIEKLAAKIQSIVAVPSAEYQITYYAIGHQPIGDAKIGASFEILPKDAAEKVTKANAQLHIRMALVPSVAENRRYSDDIAVIDTVLTGNSISTIKVDKSKGIVTIEAVLPVKKTAEGEPEMAPVNMKTFFSLGVSDFAATYNEIQSEYVAATSKRYDLLECHGWYCGDTLVTDNEGAVVDTAANKHCYNEGAQNFGKIATLKFKADFADGEQIKTVDKLSAYLGDSLYVTYSVAGNTIGSGAAKKEIKVALQDSTDATYAAKFKAVPDTSKSANTSIAAYEIIVTPTLMSKNLGTIEELPVWKAKYEVTKFEHNATYNLTNDWALWKGTDKTDSIVFAIDNADSAYFVANDIVEYKDIKKSTNHALNNGASIMKIAKSLADNSKLKLQYRTAKFDTVAVKDTVVILYDNGTNHGEVTLAITSGAAPVFRGSDSIEDFNFVKAAGGKGDTVKLSFNKVVPYFEGKADSTWTGFPANHDSLLYTGFAMNGKTKAPYFSKLKDTLKVVQLKGQPNIVGAYVYKELNYGRTYVDTLRLSAGSKTVAKMFYEFPFSFKTVDCPFKVINTQTVDSLSITGKLKSGDTLKFHHDSINVAEFYKIVWSADSSNYDGKETVTVDVTCGKETKNVASSNKYTLKPLYFQIDSLLKYKTVFASTVYRSSIKNEEKCESKKFVEKNPITAFTIKDSIKVVRTQTKADTIRIDGANGCVIKIEASDITLDNAWDSMTWKVENGVDLYGVLNFIDNTNVLLKVDDRITKLNGSLANEGSFKMILDPVTNKPIVVIGSEAQKADYEISVPFVAHKYLDENEYKGNIVVQFTKQ